jgi:tRNA/tmRNA/rRNA uracil-C5-methylase (TrmA/RlmC/RlmD family)
MFGKEWGSRVLGALNVLDKAAEKQQYDATHTVDGKDLKVGLKVFVLEDPSIQWTISKIDEKIYRRRVALEANGQESISRTPYQLLVSQKKAVDASIIDIKQSEQIILRDMRESLSRLDAPIRVKKLNALKKKLK